MQATYFFELTSTAFTWPCGYMHPYTSDTEVFMSLQIHRIYAVACSKTKDKHLKLNVNKPKESHHSGLDL